MDLPRAVVLAVFLSGCAAAGVGPGDGPGFEPFGEEKADGTIDGARVWAVSKPAAACRTQAIEEDFGSVYYHAHRYDLALGDGPASIELERTAGGWAPALVIAVDEVTVFDGSQVAEGAGDLASIEAVATGREDAIVSLRLAAAAPGTTRTVSVHVTGFRVLDHARSASLDETLPRDPPFLPSDARYTLRVEQSCDEPRDPLEVRLSYYHTATELDHWTEGALSETTVPVYDADCNPIAEVARGFWQDSCLQGSGILTDGRMVNVVGQCSCGEERCAIGGRVCYQIVDSTDAPWGIGARGRGVEPLRSWAVDRNRIRLGTVMYVPEWDGYEVPRRGELGGYTHDGCFRADDVGGAIGGTRVDIFSGTEALWQATSGAFPTGATLTIYRDSPRCAHIRN